MSYFWSVSVRKKGRCVILLYSIVPYLHHLLHHSRPNRVMDKALRYLLSTQDRRQAPARHTKEKQCRFHLRILVIVLCPSVPTLHFIRYSLLSFALSSYCVVK
jgi:hypothetical protein